MRTHASASLGAVAVVAVGLCTPGPAAQAGEAGPVTQAGPAGALSRASGPIAVTPAVAAGQTVAPVPGVLSAHDISGIYVAGVSADGYMAIQLQVAYSSQISGAAIFAAGPYYCAQFALAQALEGCTDNAAPDHLAGLEADAATWGALG
ncbi:MAG TPA: hypothetical protein VFX70_18675 [Mycobacteriales bacterium]|nr:hypothetical protein [Mycobacteriales bacterium]